MDAPKEKPSAFEARSGKLKFDILGRKVKGEKGNMLKARTAGVAKRKSTLSAVPRRGQGERLPRPPFRRGRPEHDP